MAQQIPLSKYDETVQSVAQQFGIPLGTFRGLLLTETGNAQDFAGNPNLTPTVDPFATSSAGAEGLGQFLPSTALDVGLANPYDAKQSIFASGKYLSQQYRAFGSWDLALAAYNAGPQAVTDAGNAIPPYKETQNYVSLIDQIAPLLNSQNLSSVGFGVKAPPAGSVATPAPAPNPHPGEAPTMDATAAAVAAKETADSKNRKDWLSAIGDFANNLALDFLVGSIAIALIAGGFVWLAASNPQIRSDVTDAIKAGAAA